MELIQNLPSRRGNDSIAPDDRAAVHLLSQLQTTLEPQLLITIFCREIQTMVKLSGFEYQQANLNIEHQGGHTAHHCCNYELNLDAFNLGSLKLMRRKRFEESELRLIETFLGHLFYPLRNALMYQEALRSSHTDALTGLFNRATLATIFERESNLAKRRDKPFSLLMLDIDHFKNVNDQFGHTVGDQTLKAFANCLKITLRGSDAIFRTGGEEFMVILSDTDLQGAELLAERLRLAIENLDIHCESDKVKITTSIGVAEFRQEKSAEDLADRADKALYQAKNSGRNQIKLAD